MQGLAGSSFAGGIEYSMSAMTDSYLKAEHQLLAHYSIFRHFPCNLK
jgi:hypothetical protein